MLGIGSGGSIKENRITAKTVQELKTIVESYIKSNKNLTKLIILLAVIQTITSIIALYK